MAFPLRGWLLLLVFSLAGPLLASDAPAQRMEVLLERMEGKAWRAIDPGLVLDSGDLVRFRFRATFPGYLYVINHGTAGTQTQLFPRVESRQNRVEAGRNYLVPAVGGAFRVAGPPGQDVMYWMVSPVSLGTLPPDPASELPTPKPPRLMPRCDDTLLRARGECVDSSAGAKPLAPRGAQETAQARDDKDLFIIREKHATVVASPAPMKGPVVYEFRLAHR